MWTYRLSTQTDGFDLAVFELRSLRAYQLDSINYWITTRDKKLADAPDWYSSHVIIDYPLIRGSDGQSSQLHSYRLSYRQLDFLALVYTAF